MQPDVASPTIVNSPVHATAGVVAVDGPLGIRIERVSANSFKLTVDTTAPDIEMLGGGYG